MEIKPNYEHTKLGTFMFNICAKGSVALYKHRWLYWLIQFTWGLPMILFGLIVSLVLLCCGKKPIKTDIGWRFEIGENWGGMDCGIVYVRDKKMNTNLSSLDYHEMGHCLTQNAILGPFFIFIVAIPSATRYWFREIFPKKVKTSYDAVWFEDLPTVGGEYFIKNYFVQYEKANEEAR